MKQKGLAPIVVLLFILIVLEAGTILSFRLYRSVTSYERAGLGSLRTIITAEISYRAANWTTPKGDPVGYSVHLSDLGCRDTNNPSSTSACLIDDVLANAISATNAKAGYYYLYERTRGGEGFHVNGNPVSSGYFFFTDESGLIRVNRNRPATSDDPPVQGP